MEQEANEAPTDHLIIREEFRESVIEKFLQNKAYEKKFAVTKKQLELFGEEEFAFNELLRDEAIIKIENGEGEELYYLVDELKPRKSYRKQITTGLSIPILLFLTILLVAGIGAIVYSIVEIFIT